MRAWRRMMVVSLAVVAASCGSAPTETRTMQEAPDADAAGGDLAAPLPGERDWSPSFDVGGAGLWYVGGLLGTSEKWTANPVAAAYDPSGKPVRSVSLALPPDSFIAQAQVMSLEEGVDVVVASACVIPGSENPSCNSAVTPLLYRIDGSGAAAVPLPEDLTAEVGTNPGDGAVFLRGIIGGRLLLTRSIGEGAVPVFTDKVGGWLVDPMTGAADVVTVPDGVLTPTSMCANESGIYSMTVALDENLQLASVGVLASSSGSDKPAPLTQIDGLRSKTVTGGTVSCLADSLVLQAAATPAEVVVVSMSDGVKVSSSTVLAGQISRIHLSADRSTAVITSRHLPPSEVETPSEPLAVDFYVVDSEAGLTLGATTPGRVEGFPLGVQIDGELVDAYGVVENPAQPVPFARLTD